MSKRTGIGPLAQRPYQGLTPGPLGRISYAGIHESVVIADRMRMRYWNTYSLVYVRGGTARLEDQDGRNLPVGPGDLMLMFPRHGYRYLHDPAAPWTELFIQFDGPVFDLWRKTHLLRPADPVWHLEPIAYWWPKLAEIAAPGVEQDSTPGLRRLGLLHAFLAEAHVAAHRRHHDAEDDAWLVRARARLDEDLGAFPDWNALAARLDMTYDRFRKRFRALTGQAPAQYRALRRIAWAGELLKEHRRPLADIAATCGFHDVFHFSKRFQQATGLTPAQFRQRQRG